MDPIDAVLVAWFVGSLLLLGGIELLAGLRGAPSISERIQAFGRRSTIVVIIASFAVGFLLAHFFDQ